MSDAHVSPLPHHLVEELTGVQWLEPWWDFENGDRRWWQTFEKQLLIELCDMHVLYPCRMSARAISKRNDCDDVLFWTPQAQQKFVVVHLTWSKGRETDPTWPRTSLFNSITDFVEQDMIPTHRDWSI